MTTKYPNGRAFDTELRSRVEYTIHGPVEVTDDPRRLSNINGSWVSEERISIEFAGQRHAHNTTHAEAECFCSRELAARLIDLSLARR